MIPGFVFQGASVIRVHITEDQLDFSLFEELEEPTYAATIWVIIDSGVTLRQSDFSTYCFSTEGMPVGTSLYIENHGIMLGLGGIGGAPLLVGEVYLEGPGNAMRWAQLAGGGGAGRGMNYFEPADPEDEESEDGPLVSYGGLVVRAGYLTGGSPPSFAHDPADQGEAPNQGDYATILPQPGVPSRLFAGIEGGVYLTADMLAEDGETPLAEVSYPAESVAEFVLAPEVVEWLNSGQPSAGGSCIRLTCSTILFNDGKIYAGGGGGQSGNGHGAYYIDDHPISPTYSFPGNVRTLPIDAGSVSRMLGGEGGDWGEVGGVSWFTDTRQTDIYGSAIYGPGNAGAAVSLGAGGSISFTTGSDDPTVLRGLVP